MTGKNCKTLFTVNTG